MMVDMTGNMAAQAAQDQAEARERNFERRAHNVCLFILWLGFSLGVYGVLAATGNAPAAPWSPIGQYQEQRYEHPVPSPVPPSKRNVVNV